MLSKLISKILQKFFKPTGLEKEILYTIGYYWLQHNNFNYEETYKTIDSIGIKHLKIFGNRIYIVLDRPGIFIGLKGKDINAIEDMLYQNTEKQLKFYIIEDKITNYLYPMELDLY
jgi:hypothetical protein